MPGRPLIYLAAPLFSAIEKLENDRLCHALERWCDVFLPQRDGELIPNLIRHGLNEVEAYRTVFDRDISALRACDALVIHLDGRTVDEGAAFELGVAHALGKRCVGYRTDIRVLLPWGLNPMITVPLSEIFASVDALETWAMHLSLGDIRHLRLAE
jgi:nucleoside 2-deoxyribosyltransferase